MAKGTALAQDQLTALAEIVGPDRVLAGPEAADQYGRDWTRAHAPAPRSRNSAPRQGAFCALPETLGLRVRPVSLEAWDFVRP